MTTLDEIVRWFETLTRESAGRVDEIYAPDAFFKDPFNEVRGTARIRRIYEHMFEQVGDPRFAVESTFTGEDGAILAWTFTFRMSGRDEPVVAHGVTHLRFAADGRIRHHRDYWDPAEELYEKIPVLGGLMRLLKRKLRTP